MTSKEHINKGNKGNKGNKAISKTEMNIAIKMFRELEELTNTTFNNNSNNNSNSNSYEIKKYISKRSMTDQQRIEHRRLQYIRYANNYRQKQKEKEVAREMFIELTEQELNEKKEQIKLQQQIIAEQEKKIAQDY